MGPTVRRNVAVNAESPARAAAGRVARGRKRVLLAKARADRDVKRSVAAVVRESMKGAMALNAQERTVAVGVVKRK